MGKQATSPGEYVRPFEESTKTPPTFHIKENL
jgi:hypothetical protein